jgi:hypothetical protein
LSSTVSLPDPSTLRLSPPASLHLDSDEDFEREDDVEEVEEEVEGSGGRSEVVEEEEEDDKEVEEEDDMQNLKIKVGPGKSMKSSKTMFPPLDQKRHQKSKGHAFSEALVYSNELKMQLYQERITSQERERAKERAEEARRWDKRFEFDRLESIQRHKEAMAQLDLQSKKLDFELQALKKQDP